MADDLMAALRSLANRWVMKARDYARQSKDADEADTNAAYQRGFAEGYYRAATELAALLKDAPAPRPSAPPPNTTPTVGGQRRTMSSMPKAPPPQSAPTQVATPKVPLASQATEITYKEISVGEAISILVFAGCQPREVTQNRDNSLHATFSSWGSMMLHEQISHVQSADPRIIVLDSGKLETHDYYIDFAFKDN